MPSRQLSRTLGCAVAVLLCATPQAIAAPTVVLSDDGDTRVARERLPAPLDLPVPGVGDSTGAPARVASAPRARLAARSKGPTVRGELRRMRRRGQIDPATQRARLAAYEEARATARRLTGLRGREMSGVVSLVDAITARRELTASRLAPLWLTLERNAQWWRKGPLPSSGQRLQFENSELLWQYMPGQGLQLHPLANFGRLNGLWQGGRRYDRRMAVLMDELLSLRVDRAGGVAWEYYFTFGPSSAPWVSGMAQATALQALVRAAQRLSRPDVPPIAHAGLAIFDTPAPAGVRVSSGGGAHYLLYSGDPALRVLNGFVQALSGLESYATATGDARAQGLYGQGRQAVAAEIAAADTGAWSLYSLGRVSVEASLSYHQLLTGFLRNLCVRTGDPLYCDSHARFDGYVSQAPTYRVLTRRLRAGAEGNLRFKVSKRSHVALRIEHRGGLVTSRSLGTLPHGRRSIRFTPPRGRAGSYTVSLTGTDVAGNRGSETRAVTVLRARSKQRSAAR